jgi:MerR-like DNA binding protein
MIVSTLDPQTVEQSVKRRESWPAKAKRHGVSTRTLDRWVKQGLINRPEYIRGRKYGDPDEQPLLDAAE